jgi:predicted O-linked N-acetylglucosamine transferase (SPINDLY family)
LPAAEGIARAALRANPGDVESLYLLGSSLLFQDRFQDALGPLSEVVQRAPRRGACHRLGYCHLALGDFKSAEQLLRREIAAYPELVDAHNTLGVALINQGRPHDALAVFLEAARLDPRAATANNNVANVLGELGRIEEALPYLQKVIAANPGLADARHNLGMLLQKLKRHEEAAASLEEALRLAPRAAYTLSSLVWNELAICRWDRLTPHVDALRSQVRRGEIPAEPFVLIAVSPSPDEQRLCAQRHVREKLPQRPPLWRGSRYRHDRVRLAYLSADYSEHATAYLAAGLFERHDRSRFEVIGVSYGPDDHSPMRQRLMRAFDRFLDVRSRGDEETARLLREMEVDVAIDLKGYTTGARPEILSYRPAPVQASYLGFPGTMAAPFIDYIVADRWVLPEEDRLHYTEQVVYLPDSYQVNDAARSVAERTPSRAHAGLPRDGFVFCCFNNSYKIMPPVFAVWMKLLREIPQSALWLLEDSGEAKRRLRHAAEAARVDPARLVFAARVTPAEHLARHRLADLFLDTLPYNAHTTASDALWAGLPVLTCSGTTFAGRVAGSLLRAVGLAELVTPGLHEYETLALELARAPGRLAEIRGRLERNRSTTPLFDLERFRRHLEAAYLTMWETSQRGEPPRGFAVEPLPNDQP